MRDRIAGQGLKVGAPQSKFVEGAALGTGSSIAAGVDPHATRLGRNGFELGANRSRIEDVVKSRTSFRATTRNRQPGSPAASRHHTLDAKGLICNANLTKAA